MIFKRPQKKVLVIGLDGVSYSLIHKLAQQDILARTARWLRAGHLYPMKASLPEISAVSWTDFMTGLDSGSHGIFGFTDLKPGTYEIRFPNFSDIKAQTIWERLGQQGKKSIVINQPATYPARPLRGVLISGFVAIHLAKAVYPPQELRRLKEIDYVIDVDTAAARSDHRVLWSDLEKTLASRFKALELYWPEDWNYFELVITGTDRLHHYLWKAGENPGHPEHKAFLDYYRSLDGLIDLAISKFEALTGSLDNLFLLSDHGFASLEKEVYLNAWLKEQGLLSFSRPDPQDLSDIDENSVAFALDPNRIYLNVRQKFPRGKIDRNERERWLEKIRKALLELTSDGKKVIRQVVAAEEIYHGQFVSRGPDMVAISYPGFDLKGSVKKKKTFCASDLEGMHTWHDAFFWTTARLSSDLKITDCQQIILERYK
ncbi:MAG: alkaline phosphatase family protein [Candidatus Aminicenantales bacterium]